MQKWWRWLLSCIWKTSGGWWIWGEKTMWEDMSTGLAHLLTSWKSHDVFERWEGEMVRRTGSKIVSSLSCDEVLLLGSLSEARIWHVREWWTSTTSTICAVHLEIRRRGFGYVWWCQFVDLCMMVGDEITGGEVGFLMGRFRAWGRTRKWTRNEEFDNTGCTLCTKIPSTLVSVGGNIERYGSYESG